MPNGGVPMHMVLYPKGAPDLVLYVNAGEIHLIRRRDWDRSKAKATPLGTLNRVEAGALGWFLQYWTPETFAPGYDTSEIKADFDY
jgi:hypothetical protein